MVVVNNNPHSLCIIGNGEGSRVKCPDGHFASGGGVVYFVTDPGSFWPIIVIPHTPSIATTICIIVGYH